jgi:hypothetical protein
MLPLVRWVTIHPLLAHFTIGGLPLILLGYGLGWRRRSAAWTRLGDVALVLTAALTLGTGLFGLVSNALVPWPGGIERWRWLHLGFGVATTLTLALLAAWRLRAWRRRAAGGGHEAPAGGGLLAAALLAAALAGVTGWIGGEVLVFHAGMAVRAAGDGALAPPVGAATEAPRGFLPAMREARAAWGSIQGRLAAMLVQRPRAEEWEGIAGDAQRLRRAAEVMAEAGSKDANQKRADMLATMSQTLRGDAIDLEQAARKRNLQELAHAVGETSGHCADCHEELRWKK